MRPPIRQISNPKPVSRMNWLYGIVIAVLQIGPASAQNLGQWSAVVLFPNIPVSAAVLPNGKVLTWSAYQPNALEGDIGMVPGQTYNSTYDPVTGVVTAGAIDSMMADMFCSGIAYLTDGRVMVNGGSSSRHTALYNPLTDAWAPTAMMNIARGYNSTVTLSTGEAFTIGGSWSGDGLPKDGEVWSAAAGWRQTGISETNILAYDPLDGVQGYISQGDAYPWLFAASKGRVFHAGPSPQMNWIDTTGEGSITPVGNRADDAHSVNGVAVMYQPGKILKAGGAPSFSKADASASAYLIDITAGMVNPAAAPVVRKLTPMAHARAFANGVALPGGQVLIIGGQSYALTFSDDTSVLAPEVWNPQTESFIELAPMATPRNYHSVAVLLPDARVFSGGGGLCGDCDTNHLDGAIFSPPYLFKPDGVTPLVRPMLTALSSSTAALGSTLWAATNGPVASFELIRLSATTHTVNNDQRRVPLTITGKTPNNVYALAVPADPGLVVPGYWMLFAMDAYGTPSVSKIVLIKG